MECMNSSGLSHDPPVLAKVLKAEDVEQTNADPLPGRFVVILVRRHVQLVHDPHEHAAVDGLDEGIPHVDSLALANGGDDDFALGCGGLGG